jgi:hypothetical protein
MSTFSGIDALTGYTPSSSLKEEDENKEFEVKEQQQKDVNDTIIQENDNSNKDENKEEEATPGQEDTNSNIITSIKERCIEIFKDQINRFYTTLRINDHIETMALESSRFKNVIRNEYFYREGKILTDDKLDGIIKLIESELMFNDDIRKVNLSLRVAKTNENDTIYYDLTNSKWEIVKITSEGWDIIKNNDIPIFKRYEDNCSSQVYPSKDYDKEIFLKKFLKLFNLESKNDIILLSVYMISLFIPDIPKVILVVSGTGGGAKTTTFKMIKNIVDPCVVDTFSFPKQINDLVQTLAHHHVNYFDNISSISGEISDLLCRAVTGAGINKRALFKNDTDIIYKFKRCIGVNGINLATTRPDFLDRALVIKLKRINDNARRKEEDIDREFEELKPFVLGYIFDVLVKVLKYRKDHHGGNILNKCPRMADFAEWGEIISRCMGHDDGEFINAYYKNIDDQNDEVIESSPVAEALLLFVGKLKTDHWEGTPTSLLKELTDIIDQIKPELKRSNLWPKASNKLTSKINEIVSNLKEKGIEIITGEKNIEGNRIIRIRKLLKNKKNAERKEGDEDDQNRLFNPYIHRCGYSDTFACSKCPQKGDIHYMKQHIC